MSKGIDRLIQDAFDFVHAAQNADDIRSLSKSFARYLEGLGVHRHVCLQLTGPGGVPIQDQLAGSWDRRWEARYMGREYFRHDAVLRQATGSDVSFAWSDLPRHCPLSEAERLVMNESADFGQPDGFVTPYRNVDGSMALVTLFGSSIDADPRLRTALRLTSVAFGGAIRRDFHTMPEGRRLTQREAEIVSRIAAGARQSEVADRLHLSERTVEQHLRNARTRLGVTTSAQLCVEALRYGLISM
ncbi:hypothetical protein FKB34_14875 [Glycocaulis profundi]|nr:hypothetical protein FKB34_14875 [Glycocaulis profundi]